MSGNKNDLMTTAECAAYVRLKPKTIRNKVSKGEIPFERPDGGHPRFRRSAIDAWLAGEWKPEKAA